MEMTLMFIVQLLRIVSHAPVVTMNHLANSPSLPSIKCTGSCQLRSLQVHYVLTV